MKNKLNSQNREKILAKKLRENLLKRKKQAKIRHKKSLPTNNNININER